MKTNPYTLCIGLELVAASLFECETLHPMLLRPGLIEGLSAEVLDDHFQSSTQIVVSLIECLEFDSHVYVLSISRVLYRIGKQMIHNSLKDAEIGIQLGLDIDIRLLNRNSDLPLFHCEVEGLYDLVEVFPEGGSR